jgi:hypothetical protein
MDRKWTTVIVFVATMLGWNTASAETFTPVPVLGNTVLDFDTQSGNYSGWVINDIGSINAVRTTLKVHRLGSDPKWAPQFIITLWNGKSSVASLFSASRAIRT